MQRAELDIVEAAKGLACNRRVDVRDNLYDFTSEDVPEVCSLGARHQKRRIDETIGSRYIWCAEDSPWFESAFRWVYVAVDIFADLILGLIAWCRAFLRF